jgi:hypothetical protein
METKKEVWLDIKVTPAIRRKLGMLKEHLGLRTINDAIEEALKTCEICAKFEHQTEKLNNKPYHTRTK